MEPIYMTRLSAPRTLEDATIIFVLGGPGSGKSSHCVRLAADLNLIHIDINAMLLQFEQTGPAGAVQIVKSAREEGKLAPVGLIMSLLKEQMTQRVDEGCNTFLLDGFPCSMDHYLDYSRTLSVNHVLYLKTSQDSLYFRCVDTLGIPLDVDAATSILAKEKDFKKRLALFRDEGLQVIHFLDAKGIVATVDAEETIEEVYDRARNVVETLLDDFASSGRETTSSSSSERVFQLDGV